jgi:O-antigen ligase
MVFLFLLMSAYFVLPLINVPFMGLSLSAPIFALITLQVLFRPPAPWMRQYQGWIFLALMVWAGIFISTTFNGLLSGGGAIDRAGWVSLVQYAYWLLSFVITAYFASREGMLERVSGVLGWAVFGLGLARLFEAVAWGKVGAWTSTQFMSQNGYGILFSTFFPFLLFPILTVRGSARLFMLLRLLVTGAAVLINGSRGSWIGVAAGIFTFALLNVLARPKKIGWSVMIVAVAGLLLLGVQFAPERITSAFSQRFATFQKLEEDKSYQIRQLMIQKGLRLFEESPWIGVGVSRFTKESTMLEIPRVLTYAGQEHFDVKSAHNSYIAFLAEGGLAAGLPFGLLLLILGLLGFRSSLRLARRQEIWALSVYASFLGMSVHMWSISSLTGTVTWFVYGLVAAVIVLARRRAAAT